MGLPIVAHASDQKRIENSLPTGEGMRRDHVGDRPAEAPQWFRHSFSILDLTGVAYRESEDLLAVPLDRKERQRRRLPQHEPADKFLGRARDEIAIEAQDIARCIQGMNDQSRQDFRSYLMQAKLERGHHTKVPAAATNRPKEIRVIFIVRFDQLTGRRDHIR